MAKAPAKKKAAPARNTAARLKTHLHYHKDGSLWAKGLLKDGIMHGDWEWYRKDGTILRSGSLKNGAQTGTWTTYDKTGKAYKITEMKGRDAKRHS